MKTYLLGKSLIFFLFVCILAAPLQTRACDMCNIYLSIYPNDYKNTIGVVHRYRSHKAYFVPTVVRTKRHFEGLGIGAANQAEDLLEEFFSTTEVQARIYVKPQIQLIATLPYVQNSSRLNREYLSNLSGLGDATVLGLYQLYNSMGDTANRFVHRFSAGGGVKLPTGKFESRNADGELIDDHLQLGSGSTDFIVLTEYVARFGRFGTNANFSYKFNSQNRLGFSFANRMNGTANLFFVKVWKSISLMPEMGVYFERAEQDQQNNEAIANSGGNVLFSTAGGSLYVGSFSLFGRYQSPLRERLQGVQLPNYERIIAGVSMTF